MKYKCSTCKDSGYVVQVTPVIKNLGSTIIKTELGKAKIKFQQPGAVLAPLVCTCEAGKKLRQ